MRVLQLHNRYRLPGGEDDVVHAEAAVLREHGHEVRTVEIQNPDTPLASARALAQAPWNRASANAVRSIVRRFRPDVAHVHNTWFRLTPSILAAIHDLDVPTVLTLHNYRVTCTNAQLLRDGRTCELCVGTHPWHGVRHACYRGSRLATVPAAATIAVHARRRTWNRSVDAYIALTEFARDKFVTAGLPAERIHVKPHFTPDPGVRSTPPSASDEILYVGRLSPEKGVGRVVRAFQHLDRHRLRLVIVGDGEEAAAVRALAGPNVEFTGRLDKAHVRQRMLAARALVFPSIWYETFGLSIIEAMAAGLPVVATRLGGTPSIVGDDSGMLVPNDDDAWIDAIAALSDDLVDARGVRARERWHEVFSPVRAHGLLTAVYGAAMSNPPGTG